MLAMVKLRKEEIVTLLAGVAPHSDWIVEKHRRDKMEILGLVNLRQIGCRRRFGFEFELHRFLIIP
jgi:hypothetical protein